MNILVTGGAGYLGSILVPALLSEGHHVKVLDNFMYNQISLLDCCNYPNFTVIRGDCCDESLLKQSINDTDAIFPLACLTGSPLCDKEPEQAEEIIIHGLELILKIKTKDQIIIYPTTNSGYGVGEKGKFCTEETLLRPISHYARLKVKAEEMVLNSGNGITLRLATAFGISPRMRLDLLVNDFTYRALRDGLLELYEPHFQRNFIHVRDVAKAFIHALNHFDNMKNEPYNVGLSDANLSKWELCEEIKKQISQFEFSESADGKDPDKRDYIVSNEKIEKSGFLPDISLSLGIEELIKGFTIILQNKTLTTQLTNI